MSLRTPRSLLLSTLLTGLFLATQAASQEQPTSATITPKAMIDGTGPGWRDLGEADFKNVNGDPDTWTFKNGEIQCKGTPVGVMRTVKQYGNFEMVLQWRHLKSAGNSGVFVWASEKALEGLKPNTLPPGGIEVQILDHGYTEAYEKQSGK